MSRQVTVNKLDDWDGTPAVATFELTDDGTTYITDLNRAHAAELRALLKPYIAKAFDQRKATTNPDAVPKKARKRRKAPATGRGAPASNLPDQGAIRAWARANGYTVKPTGSIKSDLRAAYYAAQQKSA